MAEPRVRRGPRRPIVLDPTVAEDSAIFQIARKYFIEGKSAEEIATEIGLEASSVRRRIRDAKARGMVHILVVPPLHLDALIDLQIQLRYQFDLKDAIVVPGLEHVMDEEATPDKEAVVLTCCRAAADYLANSLKDGDTLAVPWGRVASYVASQLSPRHTLSKLVVLPIVGVMGVPTQPYEANTIAARMASSFGGQSLLLAAPAVAEPTVYDTVVRLPLVKHVLEKASEADVVLTPIAAPDPHTSTIVRMGLADSSEVSEMMRLGAVGEIASHWWFDRRGRWIENPRSKAVGLGLEGFRRVVARGGRVVAVVAASDHRIAPLKVAIEQGLVNVLVTDHVTARTLLKDR